jgi:phosphatidylserine/phosphatidylglycerophosphate/cardiolipin synthase-like enzyme
VRYSKALIIALFFFGAPCLSQTITPVIIPNAIADGGGTGSTGYPYAVFVRIQGWTAAASAQAYLKLYASTNNEYMWSQTSTWSNSTTWGSANQPVVTLDAGGNWSGWIFAKHNTALGATASLRAAKTDAASTVRLTTSVPPFAILSMTLGGSGGWIYRNSSPAVNKGIVAYAGAAAVGTYKSEDNGIAEGYSYGSGGLKIAVPAGTIDSLVSYNEDGTRDQVFPGPWIVTAGVETEASSQTGQFGPGTAIVSPAFAGGGNAEPFTVRIRGEAGDTIRGAAIIVPAGWIWSGLSSDVSVVAPGVPAVSVAGDTILIGGVSVGAADSLQCTVTLTPKDTTATLMIPVLTGRTPDSLFVIKQFPTLFVYGIPTPIAVVKENDANGVAVRTNQWVTVRGVVTVANEYGSPSYIQDNTGGIAVYGSSFSGSVALGDELIVSGIMQPFNGLCEIVSPILDRLVSHGNPVLPREVTAGQIAGDGVGGVEQFEGMLVRLNGVTVTGSGTWGSGANYPLTDASGSTELRVDNNTNLVGAVVPGSAFDVVGVVGQYIQQSPYIGGYQLMPRSTADIFASGPIIASEPRETEITPTSMAVIWTTLNPGTSELRYGLTPALELGLIADSALQTGHRVVLTALTPATVYYIRAVSRAGADSSVSSTLIASTASPAQATGAINVYFNKSINAAVAWQQPANGNQDLVAKVVVRINAARRSIDAALYSLSGTPGPGTDIANALINAKNRGVRVRVICETDNRSTAPFNVLVSNGVPLITDSFDPINAGAGLMHNKFFIFDARGGAPESVWVWTGSWNPTDAGTNADYQNAIEIQDPALAGAYLLEFNEMWGASGDTPDAGQSRFGSRKTDNTPHRFVIGGREVESYFSPTDRTTSHIIAEIDRAQHSVAFCLLTLTRSDMRVSLTGRKAAGLSVRGALDNNTDTGTQYAALVSGGVDVRLKSGTSGLLHHKYAVIDAENPAWNPVTLTGSHNWSNSAETSNNENLVIIRDHLVANQYLQEFAARYYQFGGSDTIRVGVEASGATVPLAYNLEQNFPNPFNPKTVVSYQLPAVSEVRLVVYDLLGREVATLVNERESAGRYAVSFDPSGVASGVYFYRLTAGGFSQTRRMILLR